MTAVIINDIVRYSPKSSRLETINGDTSSQKLDHLEVLVLSCLLDNNNSLVAYDTFLALWNSPVATENSLNRVISSLRKKFKLAGIDEKIIINTSKMGYTFVGNINSDKQPAKHSTLVEKSKKLMTPFVVGGLMFFGLGIVAVNLSYSDLRSINIDEIRSSKLLEDTDFKLDIAYNTTEDIIAYSKKSINEKYWLTEIFSRYNDTSFQIMLPNKNIRKNAWLSPNELVVRVYDETLCNIEKVSLNFSEKSYTFETLFPCNPNSYASAIAKLDDERILITDAKFNNTASDLYIGNTVTGEVVKVDVKNHGGAGYYNVITHQNSQLVVLLSSPNGIEFKIDLLDPSRNWEIIWSESTLSNNYSIAWDGERLAFRNNMNGITIVGFDNNKEKRRINLPMFEPIHNVSNASSNSILLTSGQFVAQNITYYRQSEQNTFTESANIASKFAVFLSKTELLYISKETGISQIWLYNHQNKSNRQLTEFRTEQRIFNISADQANDIVAIEYDEGISVYRISASRDRLEIIDSIKGKNPFFYKGYLAYANYSGKDSTIQAYDLNTQRDLDLRIKGGFIGTSFNEHLYYSKRFQPGIWQYVDEGEDNLVLELPSTANEWHLNEDSILYRNNIGILHEYNVLTRQTQLFDSDTCAQPVAFNGDVCISASPTASKSSMLILQW